MDFNSENSSPNGIGVPGSTGQDELTPQSDFNNAAHPDNTVSGRNAQTDSRQAFGYGAAPFTSPGGEQSPSAIYRNMQNGNSPYGGQPQYHYGRTMPVMNGKYYYEQQQRAKNIRTVKSSVRKSATVVGLAMSLFWGAGMLFGILLVRTRIGLLYSYDSAVNSAVGMLYSATVVFLPFFIGSLIFHKTGTASSIGFGKPKAPALKTVLLIIAAFGGCMIANFLTSVFISFFEGFGVYIDMPANPEPSTVPELVLSVLGTALMPPLIEEYAMRRVVLGSLRKHGDGLAILASAFCFGIFHGTPSQIPFAFMCGLLLGYVAVETESIWTSVAVHMLVNGLSSVYPALTMVTSEENADAVLAVMIYACMFAGAVAFALYLHFYKPSFVKFKSSELRVRSKFFSFVTNPLIVIMTLVFLFEAVLNYVTAV